MSITAISCQFAGSSLLVPASLIVLALLGLYWWSLSTDIPKIKGIPEVPGAIPFFGHLLKLGDDHASVCEKWWRQYGQSVFQIKLGNTRAVVVNSFDDARKMLVGHQSAVIDRPTPLHLPWRHLIDTRFHHRLKSMGYLMQEQEKGCRSSFGSTSHARLL